MCKVPSLQGKDSVTPEGSKEELPEYSTPESPFAQSKHSEDVAMSKMRKTGAGEYMKKAARKPRISVYLKVRATRTIAFVLKLVLKEQITSL